VGFVRLCPPNGVVGCGPAFWWSLALPLVAGLVVGWRGAKKVRSWAWLFRQAGPYSSSVGCGVCSACAVLGVRGFFCRSVRHEVALAEWVMWKECLMVT
jgi:hypothetical protein